jgi:hypothetical protein
VAGDAALAGTVSVRLRRVAARRAVQRLLVLGGLLIAGWLLGCAAQSAHADEVPAAPAPVVAKTPVLGDAVTTVHQREPVRRVVRAVAQKAPREAREANVTQAVLPPSPKVSAESVAIPEDAAQPKVLKLHRWAHTRALPRVSTMSRTRTAVAHQAPHVVQDHQAPMPAPDRPGNHSTAGGLVMSGATAAFPNVGTWAPAPPRVAVTRVSGAWPPAVRTAADEPSFAPD